MTDLPHADPSDAECCCHEEGEVAVLGADANLAVRDDRVGLDDLARIFSALGNPVRLRIMTVLAEQEGCYCGDLVKEFGMAQSTISHHLKILREAELIRGAEHGTWVCYCVDREKLEDIKRRIGLTLWQA